MFIGLGFLPATPCQLTFGLPAPTMALDFRLFCRRAHDAQNFAFAFGVTLVAGWV